MQLVGANVSLADLKALSTFVETHSRPKQRRPLSVKLILDAVLQAFPNTEIGSIFEMSLMMKALSFKYANIHIGYYYRVSQRFDVVIHRKQYIPILRLVMTDPRFFYVNLDWSFFYENTFSKHAWVSLAVEDSDLQDDAKPGKGKRLASCEFMHRSGLLSHPDGMSQLPSSQVEP